MTRSTSWRELDAATTPPAPRRPAEDRHDDRTANNDEPHAGDGPVDGWTDTDEFLTVEL